MKFLKSTVAAACLIAMTTAAAHASSVTRLVLKASDALAAPGTTVVDPYLDWANAGGVNEGVAGATSVANNGIDYKDSWVDTNWGDVDSVRVSMFSNSVEVAYLEFDAAGTSKTDFFALANLTSSSWTDTGVPNNFFSIEGSATNDRHWYVNRNWGGCGSDAGWMVVLDGRASPSYACSWENDETGPGSANRGFLYSAGSAVENFTTGNIGVADVFAVSVTTAPVPVPASGLLLAGGIGALVLRQRRKAA